MKKRKNKNLKTNMKKQTKLIKTLLSLFIFVFFESLLFFELFFCLTILPENLREGIFCFDVFIDLSFGEHVDCLCLLLVNGDMH